MKKIGKKLSFLTKILFVIGLLISNLSSLSLVFAYEVPEDVLINLNDDVLEIKYTEELSEDVEALDVRVYEKYTYLNGLSERVVETIYELTQEQLLDAVSGTLELSHDSIFTLEGENTKNYKLFDGTYNVVVEIVDVTDYEEEDEETGIESGELVDLTVETNEEIDSQNQNEVVVTETELNSQIEDEVVLATGLYEKEITHSSGLNVKLYDLTNDTEIEMVDGKYIVSVDNAKVRVVAKVLSGGLNPTDVYKYNDEEYTSLELVEKVFGSEVDLAGHLFGEYEVPVEVKLLKQLSAEETVVVENDELIDITSETEENYEEVVYNDSVNVLYESYEMNAEVLNDAVVSMGYEDTYLFYSESKEGTLYVLSEFDSEVDEMNVEDTTRTVLDLYNIVNDALMVDEGQEQIITYTLLKNGVDVMDGYAPLTEEDTLEDYLAAIALDDTVQLVLSNTGLTVTFDLVIVGDLNNDNLLTEEDVLELINQMIHDKDIEDIDKSDVFGFDGEVNSLDVLYLNQIVNLKTWNVSVEYNEVLLNALLEAKFNEEVVSEENYLTSGDEFTVDYILSLSDYDVNGIAGKFNYDETLFELLSVNMNYDWMGNVKDGKFIYLGDESLTGPEIEEEPEISETEGEENQENVEAVLLEEVLAEDYVVVTATFRALKSTDEESNNVITLDEIELFNSTDEVVAYYELDNTSVSTDGISVLASDDNRLSYLEVAGVKIELVEDVFEYEITVPSDVEAVDLKYILSNISATVASEVYPEELAEGENTIILTVVSESGISQDYKVTVIREKVVEVTTQVNYDNNYYENDNSNEGETIVTPGVDEPMEEETPEEKFDLSKIVIIILILIVIVGLVYLIFKDEEDEEVKKANKDVDKLKKEALEPEVKKVSKTTSSTVKKTSSNTKTNSSKNNSNTKKKER